MYPFKQPVSQLKLPHIKIMSYFRFSMYRNQYYSNSCVVATAYVGLNTNEILLIKK